MLIWMLELNLVKCRDMCKNNKITVYYLFTQNYLLPRLYLSIPGWKKIKNCLPLNVY